MSRRVNNNNDAAENGDDDDWVDDEEYELARREVLRQRRLEEDEQELNEQEAQQIQDVLRIRNARQQQRRRDDLARQAQRAQVALGDDGAPRAGGRQRRVRLASQQQARPQLLIEAPPPQQQQQQLQLQLQPQRRQLHMQARHPGAPGAIADAHGRPIRAKRWMVTLHVGDVTDWPPEVTFDDGPPIPAGRLWEAINRGDINMIPFAGVDYIIGQLEAGHISGRLHWQIYVEFNRQVTARDVRDVLGLPDVTFVQPAYADQRNNIDYVRKEDTWVGEMKNVVENQDFFGVPTRFEFGTKHRPSASGGFNEVVAAMRDGVGWEELNEAFPSEFIRYSTGLRKQYELINKPKERNVTCHLLWGPTGTGKTHTVMRKFGAENVHVKTIGDEWWDGYTTQKVILLDEFSGHKSMQIEKLLRLLDKWPVRVNVKHGTAAALWDTVYICSNIPFEEWYPPGTAKPFQVAALERRIPLKNRILMDKKYEGQEEQVDQEEEEEENEEEENPVVSHKMPMLPAPVPNPTVIVID